MSAGDAPGATREEVDAFIREAAERGIDVFELALEVAQDALTDFEAPAGAPALAAVPPLV